MAVGKLESTASDAPQGGGLVVEMQSFDKRGYRVQIGD